MRRSLFERFRVRGYTDASPPLDKSLADFEERMNAAADEVLEKNAGSRQRMTREEAWWRCMETTALDGQSRVLVVFVPSDTKVSIEDAKDLLRRMETEGFARAIMVADKVTVMADKHMTHDKTFRVETLPFQTLMIDQCAIRDTPPHRVLPPDEAAAVIKRYTTSKRNLPQLSEHDVMVPYMAINKKSVVEIQRCVPGVGKELFYRIVT